MYVYAIMLYPLVMTIFEEAYLSSLGFWVTLFSVPVFFRIYYFLFKDVELFGDLKIIFAERLHKPLSISRLFWGKGGGWCLIVLFGTLIC